MVVHTCVCVCVWYTQVCAWYEWKSTSLQCTVQLSSKTKIRTNTLGDLIPIVHGPYFLTNPRSHGMTSGWQFPTQDVLDKSFSHMQRFKGQVLTGKLMSHTVLIYPGCRPPVALTSATEKAATCKEVCWEITTSKASESHRKGNRQYRKIRCSTNFNFRQHGDKLGKIHSSFFSSY